MSVAPFNRVGVGSGHDFEFAHWAIILKRAVGTTDYTDHTDHRDEEGVLAVRAFTQRVKRTAVPNANEMISIRVIREIRGS